MQNRILAIGMATKDHIITESEDYFQIGGAVFYQSIALNKLNACVESIISIGRNDQDLLKEITNKTHLILTEESMTYTNIYDKNFNRTQKAKLTNNPLTPRDITVNLNNFKYALISPLSPTDITPETIEFINKNNTTTVLTAQGYLRQTDEKNNIIPRKWTDNSFYLKYTDILSLDENEAKQAFNMEITDKNMQRIISKHKLKQLIITRAEKGSTIYTQDKIYKIPAILTENEVDATGLGDTYIAAYIHKLNQTEDIYTAGLYASIAAKEKLEHHGALKSNEEKIEEELNKYR